MFVLFLRVEFRRFRSGLQPFFSFLLILVLVGSGHFCTSTFPNFLLFVLFCFWLGLVIAAPAPFQNFLLFVGFVLLFSVFVTAKSPTPTGRRVSPAPNLKVLPL